MKFKTKTITFNIPVPELPLAAWESLVYRFKKIKFQLRPFRCDLCGTATNIRSPVYVNRSNGLMVERLGRGKSTVCRNCLVDALETQQWEPRFTFTLGRPSKQEQYKLLVWVGPKCHSCEQQVTSYEDVEVNKDISVVFCLEAWNYNYICKTCVIDTIKSGRVLPSTMLSSYGVNEVGLRIGDNGELI